MVNGWFWKYQISSSMSNDSVRLFLIDLDINSGVTYFLHTFIQHFWLMQNWTDPINWSFPYFTSLIQKATILTSHAQTSRINVDESVLRFSSMWPAWLCRSLASSSRSCGADWSLLVTLAFGLGTWTHKAKHNSNAICVRVTREVIFKWDVLLLENFHAGVRWF